MLLRRIFLRVTTLATFGVLGARRWPFGASHDIHVYSLKEEKKYNRLVELVCHGMSVAVPGMAVMVWEARR